MTAARRVRADRLLSLDQVIDAAAELIADEGFGALTMRRLAERCGVGVTTLYGYVRTKEDLLAAVANRFFGQVELPSGPGGSWQGEVSAVFRSVHEIWLEHPELAQIAVTQPIDGLAAYRGAEVVLAALRRGGFDPEEAVDAFEVLVCFTAGFPLRQVAFGASSAIAPDRLRSLTGLPVGEFPQLVELAPVFAARNVQRRFDDALGIVLRGIAQDSDGRADGGATAGARRARQ